MFLDEEWNIGFSSLTTRKECGEVSMGVQNQVHISWWCWKTWGSLGRKWFFSIGRHWLHWNLCACCKDEFHSIDSFCCYLLRVGDTSDGCQKWFSWWESNWRNLYGETSRFWRVFHCSVSTEEDLVWFEIGP